MILIVTALRIEAAPFIDYYNLKRDMNFKRHEVFKSPDSSVMLLITRPGKIPSAIALTELLAGCDIASSDYMINIGICGSTAAFDKSTVYLCHSILDHDTGRQHYPDMLASHPFKEAALETFSVPVTNDNAHQVSVSLVDMEASALFEAGNYHFAANQMFFVKIPSDMLNPETVTKESINSLMTTCAPVITDWLDGLLKASYNASAASSPTLSSEELVLLNNLSESLRLSVTMKEQLKQLFIYIKLKDGDLSFVEAFALPEGNITNQKRKILFEELREQFLQ
ncbi:MAG: hypothetical protein J6B39_05355 [Lachnospiraceae bacterium]|nr:hypothetical protein [Lachnospiraceae bacterium]